MTANPLLRPILKKMNREIDRPQQTLARAERRISGKLTKAQPSVNKASLL